MLMNIHMPTSYEVESWFSSRCTDSQHILSDVAQFVFDPESSTLAAEVQNQFTMKVHVHIHSGLVFVKGQSKNSQVSTSINSALTQCSDCTRQRN